MADYPLSLTASEIDVALQKAHSPDTDLTETAINDPSLITSGAVKNYVDTKVSEGASITVDSFAGSSLETSSDGLTETNDAVPTSAAVVDYVGNNYNTHVNNSQWNITAGNGNPPVSRSWTVQGSITPGVYLIAVTFQSVSSTLNEGRFEIFAGSQEIKQVGIGIGNKTWKNGGSSTSFSTLVIPTGGNVVARSTLLGQPYDNRYLYIRNVVVYAIRIARL